MKSNSVRVDCSEAGFNSVMKEVDKVIDFNHMSKKSSLQLRLLTEEMLGMQKGVLGFNSGDFYVENNDSKYELHLKAYVNVDAYTKEEFVKASKDKKNEAYKGFTGKIRMTIDTFMNDPTNGAANMYISAGMSDTGAFPQYVNAYDNFWVYSKYSDSISEESSQWDELEKSVLAKLADDVIIGVRNDYAEIIIIKDFKEDK